MKRAGSLSKRLWKRLTRTTKTPSSRLSLQRSNHCLSVTLQGEIRDPTGWIIKTLPEIPANSYLRQFVDLLSVQLSRVALNITRITGAVYSTAADDENFRADGGAGATTYGIVIGDGEAAVALEDYALGNQLTTDIVYSSVSFGVPITDGGKRYFDITRTFTNNTGAGLGIKEVGLYVGLTGIAKLACIDRSLYSADVANGDSISLRYRISVTV